MRLVTFEAEGRERIGALADERYVVDLPAAARALTLADWPDAMDMVAFLALGDEGMEVARRAVTAVRSGKAAAAVQDVANVKLRAPVPRPSKIVAIGLNYQDHAREQGVELPTRPTMFAKFPTAVVGPGDTVVWDPELTQQVDLEGELAFVIGRRARNVPAAEAYSVVAGYACLNDVTARDLQFGDRQWVRGKSLDTFCPLGPWIRTRDEVPDPHTLALRSERNGQVMQDSNTSQLVFGVPALVEFITRAVTLLPGDVVATGTPAGVGVFRKPPVFLQDGDVIAVEIEGLGRLENRCQTAKAT